MKFYVSSSPTVKGKVKTVAAVPNCTWNGSAVDAGKYVAIDVMHGTKRLGSVVYVHLDAGSLTAGPEHQAALWRATGWTIEDRRRTAIST